MKAAQTGFPCRRVTLPLTATAPYVRPRPPGRRRYGLLALAAVALIAGCASLPRPVGPAAVPEANQPIDLSGRFAVQVGQSYPLTREENLSGRFRLQRDADGQQLDLISPFGQTLAQARQPRGGKAELVGADGRRTVGDTLEAVFEQTLGFAIPASRLPDWLSGRIQSLSPEAARSPQAFTAQDQGWTIRRDGQRWQFERTVDGRRIDVRLFVEQLLR